MNPHQDVRAGGGRQLRSFLIADIYVVGLPYHVNLIASGRQLVTQLQGNLQIQFIFVQPGSISVGARRYLGLGLVRSRPDGLLLAVSLGLMARVDGDLPSVCRLYPWRRSQRRRRFRHFRGDSHLRLRRTRQFPQIAACKDEVAAAFILTDLRRPGLQQRPEGIIQLLMILQIQRAVRQSFLFIWNRRSLFVPVAQAGSHFLYPVLIHGFQRPRNQLFPHVHRRRRSGRIRGRRRRGGGLLLLLLRLQHVPVISVGPEPRHHHRHYHGGDKDQQNIDSDFRWFLHTLSPVRLHPLRR